MASWPYMDILHLVSALSPPGHLVPVDHQGLAGPFTGESLFCMERATCCATLDKCNRQFLPHFVNQQRKCPWSLLCFCFQTPLPESESALVPSHSLKQVNIMWSLAWNETKNRVKVEVVSGTLRSNWFIVMYVLAKVRLLPYADAYNLHTGMWWWWNSEIVVIVSSAPMSPWLLCWQWEELTKTYSYSLALFLTINEHLHTVCVIRDSVQAWNSILITEFCTSTYFLK